MRNIGTTLQNMLIFAPVLHGGSTVVIVQQKVCRLGQSLVLESGVVVVWYPLRVKGRFRLNEPLECVSGVGRVADM